MKKVRTQVVSPFFSSKWKLMLSVKSFLAEVITLQKLNLCKYKRANLSHQILIFYLWEFKQFIYLKLCKLFQKYL